MSDEEHARRRVIRGEELIEELEVRFNLGTKCHARRLGIVVRRRRRRRRRVAAASNVGRQAEMSVRKDRHG